MKIVSPVPRGSGVEVLHGALAAAVPGYRLCTYSPWWSLLPPALPALSARDADLVHASADYGVFFARAGVPLVVTVHNYTSDRAMRAFSSRAQYLHYRSDLRWVSRMTLARANVVVAISRFIGDLIRQDLGVDPPLRTIYNGVDHQRFVPPARKRAATPFRILFCGNLNRRKRAHLLPQLAAALDERFEIHFTAGLAEGRLSAGHVASGGARLRPLGRIEHAEMPSVYQEMDALFMPSVREGFGLCVAEAMACGLPVVACGESAMPELIEPGRGGMLCAVDDVAAFAGAFGQLAEDRDLGSRMGEFNRARVEQRFTLERMIREYRELFQAVLDGVFNR
jgi:glycosyltransferase involved in cell wall biosynthesis